jgi:hypothetical protein
MNASLQQYIEAARTKGHQDDRIKHDLVAAGWDPKMVSTGLAGDDDDLVPPPPPPGAGHGPSHGEDQTSRPQAVVQTLTTRGLEYIIMFIALGVTALALGSLLHSNVNNLLGNGDGSFTSNTVSFAAAALVVALPVLAVLFLRLKKAELADPALHHDPSRKRAVQLTLIVTFLVGLGNIIFFVYSLMSGQNDSYQYNALGSRAAGSLVGDFIHLVITLAIAGGIFAYYWLDEHRKDV